MLPVNIFIRMQGQEMPVLMYSSTEEIHSLSYELTRAED
jgi:hypothetical protein